MVEGEGALTRRMLDLIIGGDAACGGVEDGLIRAHGVIEQGIEVLVDAKGKFPDKVVPVILFGEFVEGHVWCDRG